MSLLGKHLSVDDVLVDVDVQSRNDMFALVGDHVAARCGIRATSVIASLERREEVGSTGIGEGIAIPHARLKALSEIRALYLRPRKPIAYESPDGKPVSDVLILLVPAPSTEKHLELLAEAAASLSDRNFREALRSTASPLRIKQLFDGDLAPRHGTDP